MVAYSANFCLPCMEGTDSPCVNTGSLCEPSTPFCDTANILEQQLNLIDSIIGRTTVSIPMASVLTSGDSQPGDPFEWEIVDYDTDNMVDLDANASVITPQRDGIYMFSAQVITQLGAPAPFDGSEAYIEVYSGSTFLVRRAAVEMTAMTNRLYVYSAKDTIVWQAPMAPLSVQFLGLGQPPVARFTVWWVSNL